MGRRFAEVMFVVACLASWPGTARAGWEVGLGWVDEIDGRQSTLATLGWLGGGGDPSGSSCSGIFARATRTAGRR